MANPPTRSELDSLIKKYAPVVYFHPDEQYLMTSVEWFLARANLVDQSGNRTQATLDNLPLGEETEGKYHLELQNEAARAGDLSVAKAYVHALPNPDPASRDLSIHLQYWFFYAYNGPGTARVKTLAADTTLQSGNPSLAPLGEHEGDWEQVTVQIDNASRAVEQVYFSQHSGGHWVQASELEREGDQIVVFASRNGHASYPHAGENYSEHRKYTAGLTGLEFFLRNDTGRGKRLDCAQAHELISADYLETDKPVCPRWLGYRNRWGTSKSANLTQQSVDEVFRAVLGPVVGSLFSISPLGMLSSALLAHFVKEDQDGPTAIATKGCWDQVQTSDEPPSESRDALAGAAEWTLGAANDVASWTTGAASDVASWTTGAANDVASWTTGAASDVASWTTGAANSAASWTSGAVRDAGSAIKDAAETLGEKLNPMNWLNK